MQTSFIYRLFFLLITLCSFSAQAQPYDPDKISKKAMTLYTQAQQRAEDGNFVIAAGFYLAATVGTPMISTDIRIKFIGGILLAGYLVARIFFQPSLISVWCFLGIACSIVVYFVLRNPRPKSLL